MKQRLLFLGPPGAGKGTQAQQLAADRQLLHLSTGDGGGGWLLDGFPRNLAQAEALGLLLDELQQPIELVVLMELDDAVLIQRLLGRGRADDNESVIRHRLEVYREQTAPLIRLYHEQGLLKAIEANGSVDAIAERIATLLG